MVHICIHIIYDVYWKKTSIYLHSYIEGCDIHVGRLKRHNPTWRTSYTLGSHNNYIKGKCRFYKVNTMAKFKVNQLFFSSFINFTSFWTLRCRKFVHEKALKMLFGMLFFNVCSAKEIEIEIEIDPRPNKSIIKESFRSLNLYVCKKVWVQICYLGCSFLVKRKQ